jgi:4-aminobutyrate aminotransferase/(S)-3-amino-2-methylpropionate transaminase
VHAGGLGGTYGGNPVACAAALAAIETMEEEDLAGRAREIGGHPHRPARPARREVRRGGRGAWPRRDDRHGARHRPRHQGAGGRADRGGQQGLPQRGPVTLTCGTYGNVFRFLPPLSISDDLLHEGMDVLEESFTAAVG